MKKKTIFVGVFAALLFFMSFIIYGIYDEANFNKASYMESYLNNELQSFTLSLAKHLDKNYEPLVFNENMIKTLEDDTLATFNNSLDYGYSTLIKDQNFNYWAKNIKTEQIISNLSYEEISKLEKESMMYIHVVYDEKGIMNTIDNKSMNKFSDFYYENFIDSYLYLDDGTEIHDYAEIQNPKNMEFIFRVPIKPVLVNESVISDGFYQYEIAGNFVLFSILVGTSILALFILCYPIRIVKAVQPFKSISRIKGEIAVFLFTFAIIFAVAFTVLIAGYSISGLLESVLLKYDIDYASTLIFILNISVWSITFIIISLTLFYIKYIFACGFIRYLKEDTLIGMFVMKLKNSINAISDIDMKKSMDRWFFKITFINFIAIIVCGVLWGVAFIPALIYSVVIFLWMKKKYEAIQVDYLNLQGAAHSLANGNFDVDNNLDVGIFNSLNEEFKNIRFGFEKAVKEETKSQNMKTELITNVSHDLKTPLTGIRNYVELLQQDDLSENTRKEYVGILQQYSNRLSTLIEDLFEVSKVNSGNIHLDIMELDINALLDQAHAECSERLDEKQLTIIKNSDTSIMVELDGGKTFRIFENLFTNIAKYALSSTRVYVDIVENKETVEIQFKNVSEEPLNFNTEEIVERFVRGDKSRHTSGSGLGLAIVKSFTEAQDGSFKIETDGDLFKAIVILPKHVDKKEA